MNEREQIKEVVMDTKIYDAELPQKVVQALSGDIPKIEPNERLGMDIVFNKTAYQQVEFYRYELTQEHKGPDPKTDREKVHQKIYDILSEQLDKVISSMKELGCVFGNTGIIGDDLEDDSVHIVLYRQEASISGKGKRQTETNVRSVMPDRPYIVKKAAEHFARMFFEQMSKENAIEIAKKNHKPNWISAGELFTAISDALEAEIEDNTDIAADKLIKKAVIASDWPLRIQTRFRDDKAEPVINSAKIDCPEYIIFILNDGGSWELYKVDDLRAAQQAIVKQGFHYKHTKAVIVLKGLEKVPYTLFAETDDGLIAVAPSEANAYKKLHVSWVKGN
ncbi:MAG: hypothetical protein Q4F17_10610 [Eubacteriales bacterium]|nr:hypothetical protein [Eubacteriales bacterium]